MTKPTNQPTTCDNGKHVFRQPLTGAIVKCDCGMLSYRYDGRTFAPIVVDGIGLPSNSADDVLTIEVGSEINRPSDA